MGKLRTWYKELDTREKVVYAVAAAIALLIFANLITTAYLWVESAKEGLSIHLEPENRTISVPRGSEITLEYELAINNPPGCYATCEYSLFEQENVLYEDQHDMRIGEMHTIEYSYQSSITRRTQPLQLQVTCTNDQTTWCQRAGESSVATTSVAVTTEYSQQERTRATNLSQELQEYNTNITRTYNLLLALQNTSDQRLEELRTQASEEQEQLQTTHEQILRRAEQDELGQLAQLLEQPRDYPSITSYNQLREYEQLAAQTFTQLKQDQPLLEAVLRIVDEQERALTLQLREVQQVREEFYTTNPREAYHVFNELVNATERFVEDRNQTIQNASAQLQEQLQQERRMICTLKNATCPPQNNHTTTFIGAVNTVREACQEIQTLNNSFLEAQQRLEIQLNTSLSEQEAQQVRAGMNQTQIRADARTGVLSTRNSSERLAITLETSNTTKSLQNEWCTLRNRTVEYAPPITPTLGELPEQNTTLEQAKLPDTQCCNHLTCSSCRQSQTLILFVHGHSFAQANPVESSLQSFERLAYALQQEANIHYAGRIYPQPTATNLQGVHGNISLLTTYYLNSYAQDAEVELITQKNYNIETYALRLREAIRNAQQATNAQETIIVAHSMGGLVTRSYLDIFGGQDISHVVMIATPNQGTSGQVARLCPLVGGQLACEDMRAGSVFLEKLSDSPPVPTTTIAGVGCQGSNDGVVDASSVELPEANNILLNGSCESTNPLHNQLLDPQEYPRVLEIISNITREPRVSGET